MDSRYHIYRRHVLQAREAIRISNTEEDIAFLVSNAGRELLLMMTGVPLGAAVEEYKKEITEKIQDPQLTDVVQLTAMAAILANPPIYDENEGSVKRWRQRVAELLRQMDDYLVQ